MTQFTIRARDWRQRIYNFNYFNRSEWVKAWAARTPVGAVVLDVGAGSGQYRPLFAHCDYRTHDFGQEPGTIGSYAKLDYESDITSIPIAAASVDVILCTEVLEHVPEPIPAVREMARILKPGGRLLLTAPLGSLLHQQPYHFYGGYTPYWYEKFVREAGFVDLIVEANRGFFASLTQESTRFRELIRPRNTRQLSFMNRAAATLLWLLAWPCDWLFPPIAYWLDSLKLERVGTIGYHVSATRRSLAEDMPAC
jgi:SAM-dependent methyltransferase